MKNVKNRKIYKIAGCLLTSGVASLGTIPYGYFFAGFLIKISPVFAFVSGILFAATAAIANIALGTYSLLSFRFHQKNIPIFYLLCISFISAISAGCMNFFAYAKMLPLIINSIMTAAVIITNAAIASVALYNTVINLHQNKNCNINTLYFLMRWTGFTIGVLTSFTAYVASAHGISQLLTNYIQSAVANHIAFFISIIIWLPAAALFGNSVQLCFESLFFWIKKFPKNIVLLNKNKLIILLFSLLSSSSFTQITITFFDVKMNIPYFLKTGSVQFFIHYFIIPFSMLSSCFVNYLALTRVIEIWNSRKHR